MRNLRAKSGCYRGALRQAERDLGRALRRIDAANRAIGEILGVTPTGVDAMMLLDEAGWYYRQGEYHQGKHGREL
ncbi:MAG TPA: hypothetical protein PKH77_28350 [Anaerolineae bacterium]|nr:hypothetical protein [Anaerolineae bacterium]